MAPASVCPPGSSGLALVLHLEGTEPFPLQPVKLGSTQRQSLGSLHLLTATLRWVFFRGSFGVLFPFSGPPNCMCLTSYSSY